ncbi:LemA family protein [Xenorhabdus griffiniae]|uniref:LemA family protein n=1 Tax=Xenorhabdus griffiniae TaxID=351672 RepID=UPI00235868BF|nr:LemA family protein [Xenorhabdus griffiniae]MDC9605832.1 LemA family protein [Xenorhabdus griffiniae]
MEIMITIIIFFFFLISGIIGGIRLYNRLVLLRNNVDNAFANIDVILKQQAEQIPALIAIVSKAMSHERGIFTTLSAARQNYLNSGSLPEKIHASNQMEQALKTVIAISENYPMLISGENFIELQKAVSNVEDKLARRRESFNDAVTTYNIGIQVFPALIVARALKYQPLPLLEISAEEKKYNGIRFE